MFLSQGIDIVDNKRIEMLFTKYGDVFKKKILSKDEIIDIDKIISQKKKFKKFQVDMQLRKQRRKQLVPDLG